MVIKAVVFDVDGVLFDSIDTNGKYLWSKNATQDLGLRSAHFKKIYSSKWDAVTRGTVSTISHLTEVFNDELFASLNLRPEKYIEYWLSHDVFLNTAMLELAASLSVPAYIGTNQDLHRTQHIKKLVGPVIKDIFSSYEMGYIKPEVGFYTHIEKALKLAPHEILLIDDTLANVAAAQERGWHTIQYQSEITDLRQLLRCCRR